MTPIMMVLTAITVFVAGTLPWVLALAGVHCPEIVAIFRSLCHQLPERTLELLGTPLLVCSRCAGIYAGISLGAVRPLPTRWLPYARRGLAIAVAVMVAEVVAQDLGLHPPWHVTRLATGWAVGWISSAWMFGQLRVGEVAVQAAPRCDEELTPREMPGAALASARRRRPGRRTAWRAGVRWRGP